MKGKTVLVTGPTSGIGKEIARGLARQGASLILACRSVEAGTELAAELRRAANASEVEVVGVDLSRRESVKALADAVARTHRRLDVLVNNAGVSRGPLPWAATEDGIEVTFATNVVGYFLTSTLLLPLLTSGAPARIVNVASTFASDLDLDDLEFRRRPFDGMKAYAHSKACDRLLTWALARRLPGTGVTANAMAPGLIVETGLYRHASEEVRGRLRQRGGGRTPEEGADTAVWLASSPDLEAVSGKLFENRREIPCQFRGRDSEERLWGACERFASGA